MLSLYLSGRDIINLYLPSNCTNKSLQVIGYDIASTSLGTLFNSCFLLMDTENGLNTVHKFIHIRAFAIITWVKL